MDNLQQEADALTINFGIDGHFVAKSGHQIRRTREGNAKSMIN